MPMMLSMTTDYAADTGCPEPYLRRIAEAGFTHVHWGHWWAGEFVYHPPEIEQIGQWLKEFGLVLSDVHASVGTEKNYGSAREYERRAGVELVRNRMEMTAELGGDVAVLHLPTSNEELDGDAALWDRLWRSFDEMEKIARATGVRVAIENGPFRHIARILEKYPPDTFGLCYDSGHGNIASDGDDGLDGVERLKDRLLAVHLHDNDGSGDQHRLPFTGTTDWGRLTRILAESSYAKPLNLEAGIGDHDDEAAFLKDAHAAAARLAEMVAEARG